MHEAPREIPAARELEPLLPVQIVNPARCSADTGPFAEGLRMPDELLPLDPNVALGPLKRARLAVPVGTSLPPSVVFSRRSPSPRATQRSSPTSPRPTRVRDGPTRRRGSFRTRRAAPPDLNTPPAAIAELAVGEADRRFARLRAAFESRDLLLAYIASRKEWGEISEDPRFDPIRTAMRRSTGVDMAQYSGT